MSNLDLIFERIQKSINQEEQCEFITAIVLASDNQDIKKSNRSENQTLACNYDLLQNFLQKIFIEINILLNELRNDGTILISVKNQKLLRTCFQIISCLGISPCLIPGLGVSLKQKCKTSSALVPFTFNDEQKYKMLVDCTNFFAVCYTVPVLKNIIVTFHLSDYLAALIQLSFAPLKKPGTYDNFIMTQNMYDNLLLERHKYVGIYENLVSNCFQPTVMKELLILQSVTNPNPPVFVKRVIAKEMSKRLLAPGGLLSLIRCFIESQAIDTGLEWRKIDMICKIVTGKHGTITKEEYLSNVCNQLTQIISMNNTHYLTTAVAAICSLYESHPHNESLKEVVSNVFNSFNYDHILSIVSSPGTVILSPQEIEHKCNIFYACLCSSKLEWPTALVLPNLYLLFLLGIECTQSEELRRKLKDIILKSLERLNKIEMSEVLKMLLFGKENITSKDIHIEEYEAGLIMKYVSGGTVYPKNKAISYFLDLFKTSTEVNFAQNVFKVSLDIVMDLTTKRNLISRNEILLSTEDDPFIINSKDEQYAYILQVLSEISSSPKVICALKASPDVVIDFIEYFLLKDHTNSNEECISIALVLLNTILSSSNKNDDLEKRFINLKSVLTELVNCDSEIIQILSKESLTLITCKKIEINESECRKAISDVFNDLLPVRAHGIIKLTKLIDAKDPEAISKKHYIFCLFQEQLKNPDSYIYLSAINGIASLGTHCTEDVLHVLCKEFLQVSTEQKNIETKESTEKIIELRMKIGDIIVKVTKRLGDMAIVYKTILLNTMLCGCRDEDPYIKTSALSNIAEIALVLHYKIGTIISEILFCIWNIIQTDKVIECRRAAVMVICNLLKGLGKETLIQLKDSLLPIYRTLKNLYREPNEDSVVRLHAQIALEELNDIVNKFLFPPIKLEKQIYVLDKPEDVFK